MRRDLKKNLSGREGNFWPQSSDFFDGFITLPIAGTPPHPDVPACHATYVIRALSIKSKVKPLQSVVGQVSLGNLPFRVLLHQKVDELSRRRIRKCVKGSTLPLNNSSKFGTPVCSQT